MHLLPISQCIILICLKKQSINLTTIWDLTASGTLCFPPNRGNSAPLSATLQSCQVAARERQLARSQSAALAKQVCSFLWAESHGTSRRANTPLALVPEPLCTW